MQIFFEYLQKKANNESLGEIKEHLWGTGPDNRNRQVFEEEIKQRTKRHRIKVTYNNVRHRERMMNKRAKQQDE